MRGAGETPKPQVDFLNMEHWRTFNLSLNKKGGFEVQAELLTSLDACPHCGAPPPEFKCNGGKPQAAKDVPREGRSVTIRFRRQRYLCLRCRKTSQQSLAAVRHNGKVTRRLVELAERESFDPSSTFKAAAMRLGISERTVRNIFTERGVRAEKGSSPEAPRRLGIDGVYISRKERCIITDLESGRVVEILPECNFDAVRKFLLSLPKRERVELVAMDMCRYLAVAVRLALPRAAIVIDTFHVQRMATQELSAVLRKSRIRVLNRFGKRRQQRRDLNRVHRTRFLLNRRRGKLTSEEMAELHKWRKQVPVLDVAYRLKEGFLNIWLVEDRARAEEMYDSWEAQAAEAMPKAFSVIRTSVRRWREEIFNYFDYGRATNACTEARNNAVKTLQRLGRGYKFPVIRAKLLYGYEVLGIAAVGRRPSRPRARRAGRIVSPDSNSERLRAAHEERLRYGIPPSVPGGAWMERFGHFRHRLAPPQTEGSTAPAGKGTVFLAQLPLFANRKAA